MSWEAIVLVAIGLAVAVGLLREFGLLKGRGLVFAIAAVGLLFGVSVFQAYRRRKLQEEFKEREKELKKEEEVLEDLKRRHAISESEVHEAEEALERVRADHARRLLEIEAEKEENIREARARINAMSVPELLEEFERIGGG